MTDSARQSPARAVTAAAQSNRIDFHADGVSACLDRCRAGGPRAYEGIEDGVAGKGKHPDQPGRKLGGERRWMARARGAARDERPCPETRLQLYGSQLGQVK